METRTSFVRCLRRDSARFGDSGGASAMHGRGKLKRRKMRALIVIIAQGQLFPRWSKSCWYVLVCVWEGSCWIWHCDGYVPQWCLCKGATVYIDLIHPVADVFHMRTIKKNKKKKNRSCGSMMVWRQQPRLHKLQLCCCCYNLSHLTDNWVSQ